jgi:MFS family permease
LQNTSRSQQMFLFIALYAAQGLPYGFFTLALPAMMRESGLSLTMISLASLLNLPWLLKFLWAPYLDYLGKPRSWLLSLQWAAILSALLLAGLDLERHFWLVIAGAVVFSLVAASQDVVTDGLAVRTLSTSELGLGNGIQVGAYRLGMILGGGVLVQVLVHTSWATMFASMALLLALLSLPVLRLPPLVVPRPLERPAARQLAVQWLRRLSTPGMLWLLGLICCYRFGDAMISQLLVPFLIDEQFSLADISVLKSTVGSTTSLLGAALGGWLALRMPRRTLLLAAGLAQAAGFIPYLVAALGLGGRELLWIATAAEGLIGSVATVALFTLMMDASDPEHAGTDYTLYACAVVAINGVGTFAGALLGDAFGFAVMFSIGIVLCMLGCLVLVRQLDREQRIGRVASAWSRLPASA